MADVEGWLRKMDNPKMEGWTQAKRLGNLLNKKIPALPSDCDTQNLELFRRKGKDFKDNK